MPVRAGRGRPGRRGNGPSLPGPQPRLASISPRPLAPEGPGHQGPAAINTMSSCHVHCEFCHLQVYGASRDPGPPGAAPGPGMGPAPTQIRRGVRDPRAARPPALSQTRALALAVQWHSRDATEWHAPTAGGPAAGRRSVDFGLLAVERAQRLFRVASDKLGLTVTLTRTPSLQCSVAVPARPECHPSRLRAL
jgi:hypothetical protein